MTSSSSSREIASVQMVTQPEESKMTGPKQEWGDNLENRRLGKMRSDMQGQTNTSDIAPYWGYNNLRDAVIQEIELVASFGTCGYFPSEWIHVGCSACATEVFSWVLQFGIYDPEYADEMFKDWRGVGLKRKAFEGNWKGSWHL